jgi:Mycobacterium membrane protein
MPARTDPAPPSTRTGLATKAATVLAVALLLASGCAQSVAGTPRAVLSSAPPAGQTGGGVLPASPTQTAIDVILEITGSGTALNIGYDVEKESDNLFNMPLPWRKELTLGPDTQLIQVLVAGGDAQSCRITVDGEVVAEEQVTSNAHCIYALF